MPEKRTTEERLFAAVSQTDTCWLRLVSPAGGGHTQIRVEGKRKVYAHRLAWEIATGETLTADDFICHTCDVRICVRNDDVGTYEVDGVLYPRRGHLFKAPSRLVNNRDRHQKGRTQCPSGADHWERRRPETIRRGEAHWSRRTPELCIRGEAQGQSKLTEDDIRAIRRLYASGGWTQKALAARFGVSRPLIGYIVQGKTWRHVV